LSSLHQHFGRLHIHQTSTAPEGFDEAHLVYREGRADGAAAQSFNEENRETLSSIGWHSASAMVSTDPWRALTLACFPALPADVSYEAQPLGLTTLFLLDSPTSGGDTIFSDQREAYARLSPPVQAFLDGLDAVRPSRFSRRRVCR
jgi:alpha-ketoglutarate-dependent taurine dioxygenase